MIRQLIERDQRTRDAFAIEPGLRFGLVPGRDAGEGQAGNPVGEFACHFAAYCAKPGYANANGGQFRYSCDRAVIEHGFAPGKSEGNEIKSEDKSEVKSAVATGFDGPREHAIYPRRSPAMIFDARQN